MRQGPSPPRAACPSADPPPGVQSPCSSCPAPCLSDNTSPGDIPSPLVYILPLRTAQPQLPASQEPGMIYPLSPGPGPCHSLWHTISCRPAGPVLSGGGRWRCHSAAPAALPRAGSSSHLTSLGAQSPRRPHLPGKWGASHPELRHSPQGHAANRQSIPLCAPAGYFWQVLISEM